MPTSGTVGKSGHSDFSWMEILEHHFENEQRAFMVFDADQTLLYASAQARELLAMEEYRFQSTSMSEILPGLSTRLDQIRSASPESAVTLTIDHFTPSGVRLKIELYWDKIGDHRRGKEGSVLWLRQLNGENRRSKNDQTQFLAMFNDLKVGYVQVDDEGYVQEYNEYFKTILNLPGEWRGRNLFTYPPLHSYGIAPFLVRSIQKTDQSESQVFPFGYPEIKRKLSIRWTKVPALEETEGKHGGLFCIQIEKNTEGLDRLLQAHKTLVESVSGFFQILVPGQSRQALLQQMATYWGETIYRAREIEIIAAENIAKLSERPGFDERIERQTAGILEQQKTPRKLFLTFRLGKNVEHLLLFVLPDEVEQLMIDADSLNYLHGILQKLYEKSALHEKMQAEQKESTKLSGKLNEKNRNVRELQKTLKDTNTALQSKIEVLEKQVKDLKSREAESQKSRLHNLLQALFQSMQRELSQPLVTINTLLNDKTIEADFRESVSGQLSHIEDLLTGFRMFTENKPSDLCYIDVNKHLENAILRMHRKEKILPRISRDLQPAPEILYFPDKLDQVFHKLLNFFLWRDNNQGQLEIRSKIVGRLLVIHMSNNALFIGEPSADDSGTNIVSHLPGQHGIDLFIIEQIISDMRGEFTLSCDADNGTIVTIRIPT